MEYLLEKVNASVDESSRATVMGNKKLISQRRCICFPENICPDVIIIKKDETALLQKK